MLTPKSDRSEEIRAALHARLSRVRGDLTDEQFTALVAACLSMKLRFEEIERREIVKPTMIPRDNFKTLEPKS